MKPDNEIEAILLKRFGNDSLIALATTDGDVPSVRTVDAFYRDGSFYVLTHALSAKMQQLARNPMCAICGDWFTAHGIGENLGWFQKPENRSIATCMRSVFADWIDNGHNNFADEGTCILRIRLTDGILFHQGTKYILDFS